MSSWCLPLAARARTPRRSYTVTTTHVCTSGVVVTSRYDVTPTHENVIGLVRAPVRFTLLLAYTASGHSPWSTIEIEKKTFQLVFSSERTTRFTLRSFLFSSLTDGVFPNNETGGVIVSIPFLNRNNRLKTRKSFLGFTASLKKKKKQPIINRWRTRYTAF